MSSADKISDAEVEGALTARVQGGSEVWHWIAGGGMNIEVIHRDIMRAALEAAAATRRAQSAVVGDGVDEGASELLREAASQLAAVRHDNSDLLAATDADAYTIGTLDAQLKAAREALEQYADEANWRMHGRFNPEHSQFDGITFARAALNPKAPS